MVMARDLTSHERTLPDMECLLCLVHAACRKFAGLILTAPVTCHLPSRAAALVCNDRNCSLRLQAWLLDMACFNLRFDYTDTEWDTGLRHVLDAVGTESTAPDLSAWEHMHDLPLTRTVAKTAYVPPGPLWELYFDGGCRLIEHRRMGSGGWLLC